MTIAEKFYEEYTNVAYDETGRKDWSEWGALMEKIRKSCLTEEEQVPESWDSSIIFKFVDGSALLVDNPKQGAFSGGMCVVP